MLALGVLAALVGLSQCLIEQGKEEIDLTQGHIARIPKSLYEDWDFLLLLGIQYHLR